MSQKKRYCIRNDERVSLSDLRIGDIAIMYEPDGTPCDNGMRFKVCKEPIIRTDGVCVVETENLSR